MSHPRPGWAAVEKLQQALECGALTFGEDFHSSVRAIADPAIQAKPARCIQSGVAKADALNCA